MTDATPTLRYADKWIPIKDLEIDRRVQREKINPATVERLVKNWDENLAGVVYISHRTNGAMIILDGDHRVTAKRQKFGEDALIFCRIFEGLSFAEEGYIFVGVNPGNQPSVIDKYRVGVFTGEPQAVRIDAIVRNRGYVVDGMGGHGHINAVRVLREIDDISFKLEFENDHLLNWVLLVVGKAWGNDRYGLQGAILLGLAHILAEYGSKVNIDTLIGVLKGYKRGPYGLLTEAQALANIQNMRKHMAVADRIVREYNDDVRALKNKLRPWTRTK